MAHLLRRCRAQAACRHVWQSGHRAVLVYNVIRIKSDAAFPTAPPSPSCTMLGPVALVLRNGADLWKPWGNPFSLAYLLDYKHMDENICWDTLKGTDVYVAEAMRESRAFDISLVTFMLKQECDDGGDDGEADTMILEQSMKVNEKEVDMEDDYGKPLPWGHSLFGDDFNDNFNDHHLLQGSDHFDDMYRVEQEDKGGPTGNEGFPMTRWYKAAAIVLYPRSSLVPSEDEDNTDERSRSHVVS